MYAPPLITEHRFSIYPTYVVSTAIWSGGNSARSERQRAAQANLSDNTHKGLLSAKASSRLRNAVNWLVQSAAWKRVYSKVDNKHYYFKVNFITLTIPSQSRGEVTPKLLHKMLHTFLVYSRKYYYLRNYVWKIERGSQGKIHIHLTTDTFIHYRRLRDTWNRIMIGEGLVDEYYQRTGHYDPNSTDVHSVKKVKNIGGYLCKYFDKDSGLPESFNRRIWGCNRELSSTNKCQYIASLDEVSEVAEPLMSHEIKWKRIMSKPDKLGSTRSIGELFFINGDQWSRLMRGRLREAYDVHRLNLRKGARSPGENYLIIQDEISRLPKTLTGSLKERSEAASRTLGERLEIIKEPASKSHETPKKLTAEQLVLRWADN